MHRGSTVQARPGYIENAAAADLGSTKSGALFRQHACAKNSDIPRFVQRQTVNALPLRVSRQDYQIGLFSFAKCL